VAGVRNVGDIGMQYLANGCHLLLVLDVRDTGVTPAGIAFVLKVRPMLEIGYERVPDVTVMVGMSQIKSGACCGQYTAGGPNRSLCPLHRIENVVVSLIARNRNREGKLVAKYCCVNCNHIQSPANEHVKQHVFLNRLGAHNVAVLRWFSAGVQPRATQGQTQHCEQQKSRFP
jgi:hypothetical protein